MSAVVVLALGVSLWRIILTPKGFQKGVAALRKAYASERLTEARISGFDYAPCKGPDGSGGSSVDVNALNQAEEVLLRESLNHPGVESLHGLGQFYLAGARFDDAITMFEKAEKAGPPSAQLSNDLGAAWIEKGNAKQQEQTGASLEAFGKALDYVDRALELDGALYEAHFNRALCCESMMLFQPAQAAWRDYSAKEPKSGWGAEAAAHASRLEQKIAAFEYDPALAEHFVEAYRSGNENEANRLLSENTEAITGNLLWWRLLGRYLDADAQGRAEEAKSYLDALAYAGRLQAQRGDPYIAELASFYASASPARKAELLRAHTLMDQGHGRSLDIEAAGALDLYLTARQVFVKEGSVAESYFADYWVSCCEYLRSRTAQSLGGFLLLTARCEDKSYHWLLGQSLVMLSGIYSNLNQHSKALACQARSTEAAKRATDAYTIQKSLDQAAYEHKSLGALHESLTNVWQCLAAMGTSWPGVRQGCRNYDTAAQVTGAVGLYAAAAECEKAALQLALERKNDTGFVHFCYLELTTICGRRHMYSEALRYGQMSSDVAKTIPDQRGQLKAAAWSALRLGDAYRNLGDLESAITHYDDAIRGFESLDFPAFLYDAHKGRLVCYIAQGADALTERELGNVLRLFEQYRGQILDARRRDSFFDLEHGVYDLAVEFQYSRMHDYKKAFEYSEVSRARSLLDLLSSNGEASIGSDPAAIAVPAESRPVGLEALANRLPEQAQVVQYSVLEDKLLIWAVSRSEIRVAEQPIAAKDLAAKVVSYQRSVSSPADSQSDQTRRQAMELYTLVFEPIEPFLHKERQISVVPDKALNYLPFNTLISTHTGQYLIRDYLLSFSPSSTVFVMSSEAALARSQGYSETVLSVGDPKFDQRAFSQLPEIPSSRREAEQVARQYLSASTLIGESATEEKLRGLMPTADVVHLATHFLVNDDNPMLSELVLANAPMRNQDAEVAAGALRAYEIYRMRLFKTRLVVLSACRTGLERYYNGEGMIGVSRAFLAAGVPMVVASLWSVASDATCDLMIRFHAGRRGRLSSCAALRQAQLDMMESPDARLNQPYYWASFILIGGYAAF